MEGKSHSDFSSDIVTRCPAGLGIVAASAVTGVPYLLALSKSSLNGVLGG